MPLTTMRSPGGVLVPVRQVGARLTGSLIGFSPTQIAGLGLWLDAGSLGVADGAAVAAWPDLSSSGRAGTGLNSPIFHKNVINGKPTVRLNGSNQCIFGGSHTSFPQPCTIFMVVDNIVPGASSSHDILFNLDTSSAGPVSNNDNRPNTSLFAGSTVGGSFAVAAGAFALVVGTFNTVQSSLVVNGSVLASGSVGVAGSSSGVYVLGGLDPSATRCANLDIAEVLVYASALSAVNRRSVEVYLSAKYRLPLVGIS